MRVIKQYKNGKLYDTLASQYIDLVVVLQYVLQGIEFRVVNNSNKIDITDATVFLAKQPRGAL